MIQKEAGDNKNVGVKKKNLVLCQVVCPVIYPLIFVVSLSGQGLWKILKGPRSGNVYGP